MGTKALRDDTGSQTTAQWAQETRFQSAQTQTPPPVPQSVPQQKRKVTGGLKFSYWIFTSCIFFPIFFWKWNQLVKESQKSLDTLVDYCIVSAFIFHLSTKGYTFDFDGSIWTAFQKKVSYLYCGISNYEGGLVSVKPACPHSYKP